MTWDKEGNLFCNWCGKTVILAKEVNEHDKEFNTGWTRCNECVENKMPMPKEGKIEDLPDDYNPKIVGRIIAGEFSPIDSVFVLDRIQKGLCPCCGDDDISHCNKCDKNYL